MIKEFSILILNLIIKEFSILKLDQNLNPKISDFGLAKLCSKEQSAVSMTTKRGTMGYIAPKVLSRNFGNVSRYLQFWNVAAGNGRRKEEY